MKSFTTPQFWKLYDALPAKVQHRADRAYRLWQNHPRAHSLYFKRVGKRQPVYAVRIDRGYRALGILEGEAILWFWIGSHDKYEQLLKRL